MHQYNAIHPFLIERILERFDLTRLPNIDNSGLTLLYQKWCQHIPFDNILKRVRVNTGSSAPLPGDKPTEFFETWMATGAGGTCWAGNGGLCALLQALGFPATLGISMMVPTSLTPVEGDQPKHGTVVVDFDDGPMIVDATIMHDQPIRLQAEERCSPIWGGHTRQINGLWHLQWKPLVRPAVYCRVEQLDVPSSTFAIWHEHSRNLSKFNQGVIIRRARTEGIEGIVRGHHAIRHSDGTEVSTRIGGDTLRKCLIEDFGIMEELAFSLPDDEFK